MMTSKFIWLQVAVQRLLSTIGLLLLSQNLSGSELDVFNANEILVENEVHSVLTTEYMLNLNGYILANSATWHGPLEIAADCTVKNGTIRNNSLTGDALVTITGGNVVFEDVTFDCSNCTPEALVRIAFGSKANVTFKGNCRFLAANKNVDAIYVDYCTSGKVTFDSSFTGYVGGKVTLAYESTHPNDDPAVEVSIAGSGTFENVIALDGGAYSFNNSSVSISGGRFAFEPNASCVVPGYVKTNGLDGYWSIVSQGGRVWYVDAAFGNDANSGLTSGSAFASIQCAIEKALDGDEVIVNDGYYEPISTSNKRIVIRSVNGWHKTCIDASLQWERGITNRCARLSYGSIIGTNTVLSGIALINGIALNDGIFGGGVLGGTLTNCVITGCMAMEGGGAYKSMLVDCTLCENAAFYGGGAGSCVLSSCDIEGNEAYHGGGTCESDANDCTYRMNRAVQNRDSSSGYGGGANDGTSTRCRFVGNAALFGGAVAYGTIIQCTLETNSASWHGGGSYEATLRNCLLVRNESTLYGGGAYRGNLKNCTIVGNVQNSQSAKGGGTYDATLVNCIVWGNTGHAGNDDISVDDYEGSSSRYCCSGSLVDGVGNISVNPCFRDPANGDYRLNESSPCVNAGDDSVVVDAQDLGGLERIFDNFVDIGAYECHVPKLAPVWTIIDGVLTAVDLNGCRDVEIPAEVTSIGDGAFRDCTGLTSVVIGNNVTNIGVYAFYNCGGLTMVTLPQCACTSHLSSCFSWSYQTITNVVIGEGVTEIGDSVFAGCKGMIGVTIPNSVTNIGDFAFQDCSGLTSVTIPDSVTHIGYQAFIFCRGLKDATLGNGVAIIDGEAFRGCSSLTSFAIPRSATDVGYYVFSGCSSLTNVTISGSTGDYAFDGCFNLTSVTICNDVTRIGDGTFLNCSNLTRVVIGDGVTSIGDGAFYGCTSLTTVHVMKGDADRVRGLIDGSGYNTAGLVFVEDVTSRFTVTFYGGGKTLGSATVEIGKNTNQAAASQYKPTREGYTLAGWADKDGKMLFDAQGRAADGAYWSGSYSPGVSSATWKFAGNVTAYAQWTPNKYTVTFYGGGKTNGTATVEYGKNTNQAAASQYKPTRVGYVLAGWADKDGKMLFDAQGRAASGEYWNGSYVPGTSSATWKYAGNVTAYAQWTAAPNQKYVVTFYGGGKTLGTATVEMGKNTNQAAASQYKPTRAGYVLTGWYDANGNILFDAQGFAANGEYWNGSYVKGSSSASWKYAGNVTAYANWKPGYTVTFYGGGKTLGTATVEMGKNTNQAAASVHKPTREGYVLTGWYDKDGKILFDAQGFAANGDYWNGSYVKGTSSATWKYAGNVTAYANWTPAKYVVTFYGGGKTLGTATVETGKNTYQAAASQYKPTRAGYVLTGWYDANGKILFDAQGFAANGTYWNGSYVKGVSSATWKYAGNVTAYAYWAKASVKCTVTFYGGGKTLGTATMETGKNTNQATASAYKPTRAGYTLSGWYDANDNILFDAQGRAANGLYWNGSYVKGSSSATWIHEGNVTAYAHWTQNSNANAAARKAPGVAVQKDDDELFAPGELAGAFADGGGTFALTLDEGMETAYLVTWTADGGVTRECEATVGDGTLVLTTEAGEVYRLTWEGGSLVATRVE